MDWARFARRAYDESMGRVTPHDIAQWTLDQFLIIWLDPEQVNAGPRHISVDEAMRRGLLEPGPTGVQIALDEAKRLEKEAARQKRHKRRARRKQEQT